MIWFTFSIPETLQRFIECVTAVFTQHSFHVNVGELEVCAVEGVVRLFNSLAT